MKKLLIIFVLPLLAISCQDGEKKTDDSAESTDTVEMQRSHLQNWHLNGKVKSIAETPYTPGEDGGIGDMDSCCVETMEISEVGFIVSETETNSEGEVVSVYTEERNEDGKYMSGTVTENGKEVWKRVVERDEEGNTIHALDYDSTQQLTVRYTVDEFNDYDQPVLGKAYTPDSVYTGTWSWQYLDGLRAGRTWVDSAGVQLVSRVAEVNDKGWISKVMDVRVNAETSDTTQAVETYTYDAFDDAGNWTQRTKYKDEKAVQVLKRVYTYYPE